MSRHSYRDHRGKVRETPYAPGAFVVARRPMMQQFGVVVPQGVRPGQQFQCLVNGALQAVICPQGANPGQQIIINVDRPPSSRTGADASSVTVHVPKGVKPGMPFQVFHNGSYTRVVCPEGVGEGGLLKVCPSRLPSCFHAVHRLEHAWACLCLPARSLPIPSQLNLKATLPHTLPLLLRLIHAGPPARR